MRWTQKRDQGKEQGPQRKYVIVVPHHGNHSHGAYTLAPGTYGHVPKGQLPFVLLTWLDCKTVPSQHNRLKNSTVTWLYPRGKQYWGHGHTWVSVPSAYPSAARSRPNTNTAVFLKDLKIPFDVSVSPFIDPGCKSFTMNFDTSTSSTPKCKLSSCIGIYPSHASYFGNMPSIFSPWDST